LLSLIEFSLHIFEYNLPLGGIGQGEPQTVIKTVIDQVARNGGLLVTLLHPSNYKREPHRFLWDFLLAEISRYRIFVASLAEHLKWRRQRDRIKINLSQDNARQQKLTINLPEGVSRLTIEIIGSRISSVSKRLELEDIGSGFYQLKTKKQKISIALAKNA
jgi:hypothetical protein